MDRDLSPTPGEAMLAHARRHPFLLLSIVLHAVLLGVLATRGGERIDRAERDRQQRAVDAGRRLTQQARLDKRVHDMARIESLLERGTGADDVHFSEQPRSTDELLEEARALARRIDEVARDAKADRLAKLLAIPKKKALEQVGGVPQLDKVFTAKPRNEAEAAAQIEGLEAKAREALAQRRQELTLQGDGLGPDGKTGQGMQHGPNRGQGSVGGAADPAMLARIDAFANPALPDLPTRAYTRGGLDTIFGGGSGRIPSVGPGPVVTGAGRIVGPGGTYANRMYVNRWYLIGPFAGRHGSGLFDNVRHPPEQGVVLDAVYRGKDGRLLAWEYVDMADYPLVPPVHAEDAVYYGYTELKVDEERNLTIWVGADDDAQLWLNDQLVWRGGDVAKQPFIDRIYNSWNSYRQDYNMSEGKRVVHVRKGRNKLFFKLSNGPTRIFFSLVLTT
jgi:hypothetical protein